ncbi:MULTISPECIES: hypothetical protein [unclassified Bacillus (in: firmicutes)]|uniref:hypothetical protein n=1 Tax=unclassified Bacillus (in: firmicutes) TaxID=185979 RepID=UPI0004E13386|nr:MULTISPECIES: hypothetical protein [unclassified Bacillus (in: firmicutes)]
MNLRNETHIIQVSDDIVLAQQENYCVAVVKMKGSRLNQTRFCLIITEEESLMNQSKKPNELTVLVKNYFISQSKIKRILEHLKQFMI